MSEENKNRKEFIKSVKQFYQQFAKNQVRFAKTKYHQGKTNWNKFAIGFGTCVIVLTSIGVLLYFLFAPNPHPNALLVLIIMLILVILITVPTRIRVLQIKAKDDFHWLLKRLEKIKTVRNAIINKNLYIEWNHIKLLDIKRQRKKPKHEEVVLTKFYLIIAFCDNRDNLKLYLGSGEAKEFYLLVKDFFEFQIYQNYKCPYCGAGLEKVKDNQCTYCLNVCVYKNIQYLVNSLGEVKKEKTPLIQTEGGEDLERGKSTKEIIHEYYETFGTQISDKMRGQIEREPNIKVLVLCVLVLGAILAGIYPTRITNPDVFELFYPVSMLFILFVGLLIYSLYYRKTINTLRWIIKKLKHVGNSDLIQLGHGYFRWKHVKKVRWEKGNANAQPESFEFSINEFFRYRPRLYLDLETQVKPFEVHFNMNYLEPDFFPLLKDICKYLKIVSKPCPHCGSRVIMTEDGTCSFCDYKFRNKRRKS